MGLIEESADIDSEAKIHPTAFVWGLAQIRARATIGAHCIVGRGAYVGSGVSVGARSKIQNYALIYEPATLEEGVFIGPGAILTNDQHPRAILSDGALKGSDDWTAVGVHVARGASLGAGSICIAPVRVGVWAMVGAGAVVTRDVPPFALVAGTPARQVGWVGPSGYQLSPGPELDSWCCPQSGSLFVEQDGELSPRDGVA